MKAIAKAESFVNGFLFVLDSPPKGRHFHVTRTNSFCKHTDNRCEEMSTREVERRYGR